MQTETIQATVAAYFAAIRERNLPAWLSTFAEDAVTYEPGQPPLQGHPAVANFFQGIANAFKEIAITEEFVAIDRDRAAVKWIGRGIGNNDHPVQFEGIDLFEINSSGKIQTLWGYWDINAMMAQLQS
jgi:steroid Delta-isomerase